MACSEKSTELGLRGSKQCLLGAGVLGHSLGALRHGVLGQFTGEEQTNCGLDLPGGDGATTVVVGQTASLGGDALEDVVHERVHDGHSLGADSSVRVHLLQDFVDVDGVGFPPPPLLLLVTGTLGLSLGGGLLSSLGCWFGWHVYAVDSRRRNDKNKICKSDLCAKLRTRERTLKQNILDTPSILIYIFPKNINIIWSSLRRHLLKCRFIN